MPLQMGAYAVFPPALSARASWGQYLRWRPFPALDTGRPSCDQTLHKIKEQKGMAVICSASSRLYPSLSLTTLAGCAWDCRELPLREPHFCGSVSDDCQVALGVSPLTYRASFTHDGLVRVLSCHF